jgi:hypothetical protein
VPNLCIGIDGTVGGDKADNRHFRIVAHAALSTRLLLSARSSSDNRQDTRAARKGRLSKQSRDRTARRQIRGQPASSRLFAQGSLVRPPARHLVDGWEGPRSVSVVDGG